jgi:hypothetical protein
MPAEWRKKWDFPLAHSLATFMTNDQNKLNVLLGTTTAVVPISLLCCKYFNINITTALMLD